MEMRMLRQHFQASPKENQSLIQCEDTSLVYKLKRSCEKIQQLKEQICKLRQDNDLKLKIIVNLQEKQKQSLKMLSIQRLNVQRLTEELAVCMRRMKECELMKRESEIDMIQFDKLKIKYENCQQENIILRDQINDKLKQNNMLNEAFLLQKINVDKGSAEMDKIKRQLQDEKGQRMQLQIINSKLQLQKAQLIEHSMKNQSVLNDYGEVINRLNVNLVQTSKLQQTWYSKYHDIADTVDHIQNLREAFRIRKNSNI